MNIMSCLRDSVLSTFLILPVHTLWQLRLLLHLYQLLWIESLLRPCLWTVSSASTEALDIIMWVFLDPGLQLPVHRSPGLESGTAVRIRSFTPIREGWTNSRSPLCLGPYLFPSPSGLLLFFSSKGETGSNFLKKLL